MVPGPFESPELSYEPGNAGRILRVTIGVATLFFVSLPFLKKGRET
jgi:hypothetical protein